MLDYQSFICKKCGKAVFRAEGIKYCQYCGAKLPELKELPKIVCPTCHGTGKVEPQAVQPFDPVPRFFNVMTNKTKGGDNES